MDLSSRLNKACYAIRAIKPLMSLNAMRMVYHSYVHSILSYGIIFGVMPLMTRAFSKFKKE
jgi:hypothetical protein